eukprot:gene224-16656_t
MLFRRRAAAAARRNHNQLTPAQQLRRSAGAVRDSDHVECDLTVFANDNANSKAALFTQSLGTNGVCFVKAVGPHAVQRAFESAHICAQHVNKNTSWRTGIVVKVQLAEVI